MNELTVLVDFITSTSYRDIPSAAVGKSKQSIQDYMGVALHGSQTTCGDIITSYVKRTFSRDDATVFSHGTSSPTGAALANGTFGHSNSFDDTFESIIIHPTSPVFPAALASAEISGVGGKELLSGYILGVETAYRVGMSMWPSHYSNGWHATGTIGSFGATAAAASILDLDADATRCAMGIVGSSSSSLLKNAGTMTKPLHAGHAASAGVQAALLAQDGFTADTDVLHGSRGYGTVMTPGGNWEPSKITEDLGEQWAIFDIGYKPYPSARITHAPMNAMRNLLHREELTPDDITSVTVVLQDAFTELVKTEGEVGPHNATASMEFCLAAMMRKKHVGVSEFTDDYINDTRTRELMEKVDIDFVPDLFGKGYGEFGARLVVQTTAGDEYVEEEPVALGGPENPMTEEHFDKKYLECATSAISIDDARSLARKLDDLERHNTLEEFVRILQ